MTFRPNYQRGVGGGRTVDTGPPRTNTGLTGLGAVGGATGVGAGALRVIVEFLTQYDSKEVKQLEAELARLQKLETRGATQINALRKQEFKDLSQLRSVERLRERASLSFTKAQRAEIGTIRDLERSRTKGSRAEASAAKQLLAQQTGFTRRQINQLINQDRIVSKAKATQLRAARQIEAAEARTAKIQASQVPVQQRLGRMQALKANVLPKLGALGLGAAGGIFGGALVGIGFAAAQALIDSVGQALKDVFDPANKAREALAGVAEEINKIAAKEGITLLEAAKQRLDDLGLSADDIDPKMLAAAAATQTFIEKNEQLKATLEVLEHQEKINNEAIRERVKLLAQQKGIDISWQGGQLGNIGNGVAPTDPVLLELHAQAVRELAQESDVAALAQARLAREEQQAASAAAIATIAQNRLVDALRNISGLKITGLQDQLASLGNSGPSARTLGLESQLEAMGEAQARNAYSSQLANIQEERALVLLEQRIRFQGESVRLDQLSARGQLVAIDARIAGLQRAGEAERAQLDALNDYIDGLRKADEAQDKLDQKALEVFDKKIEAIHKQGDAQDKLNQLLDLQYRMGQKIQRNEGESIGDFISRRANEQRQLLAEQSSLQRTDAVGVIEGEKEKLQAQIETANQRREAAIEAKELEADALETKLDAIDKARQAEITALNEQKERIQLQVRLQELAEQEQTLNSQEGARQRTKSLQDQLKASQEADRKAVESRRKAIEDQIKAEETKLERVLYWTSVENQERLRLAAQGANTYAEIQAISGEVAGARRVLGELRALVEAGVLPYDYVSERISNLVAIIRFAESRMNTVLTGRGSPGTSGFQPGFATGGVFDLTNGQASPFGLNIRAGEEGRELGIILSNRVARILKETSGPQLPAQMFTINKSTDPYRDRDRIGRVVRDAVGDALR